MERHFDERGFFQEHYHSMKYPWVGGVAQTSYSHSRRDVLRGLHRSQYGKLVQCVSGRLFDVMVDLRKDSPTYLNWFGIWLSGDEKLIPRLPPESIVGLQKGQFDVLSPKVFSHITPQQASFLFPDTLAAMSGLQYSYLPAPSFALLETMWLSSIPPKAISYLTQDQLETFTCTKLQYLTTDQVSSFTLEQNQTLSGRLPCYPAPPVAPPTPPDYGDLYVGL
uniref:Uncharacterized protein n=1 Tax=Arcella intermedia TaxID=1963864 RepID=A0A6B2LGC7_9EUKA